MKYLPFVLAVLPLAAHAQQGNQRFRDAAKHDQLAKTKQAALQAGSKAKPEPVKGSGAAEKIPSLLGRSDILCFNGLATLIPKRAILHQPPAVASRVNQYKPGSKVVTWYDFQLKNRGWILTKEVTRDQARGKVPLDEKTLEQFKKSSYLVIATFNGGPVSVLPAPEKDAAATAASDDSTKNQSKP